MNKNILVFMISLCFLVSGCSKFMARESENLTPFIEQTLSLVGSLNYALSDNEILHLRDISQYIEQEAPFDRYKALENQVVNQLKALVAYSVEIVTISELPVSENKKSAYLADILISLNELVKKDQVITEPENHLERNQTIMEEVRASEEYLKSLRILMPVVNDFSMHALKVLDELEREKRKIVALLEQAIDKKYGDAIAFENELRKVRGAFYNALISLSKYADTEDVRFLDEIRNYNIAFANKILKDRKKLTGKEVVRIHEFITQRMAMINENYKQLEPDVNAYYASHRELKKLVEIKEEGIKEARLTFIVWSRAYRKMALGKTNPAEWFDITNSGSLLMGAAGRAIGL